jgi:GTP cyclohydrolase IV
MPEQCILRLISMNKETQECAPEILKKLERVGIANLRVLVKTGFGGHMYKFVPSFDVFIDLRHDKKGIHMSRLVESISEIVTSKAAYQHETFENLERDIIEELASRHPFERAEVGLETALVVEKKTPVSKKDTMETHDVAVKTIYEGGKYKKILKVSVIGNTACPHSKENTGYPHIQRAVAELELCCDFDKKVGLNDLIDVVEASFSCPVYTLVKTEDENDIVRRIHDNPKFVEDVTRGILEGAKKKFVDCRIRTKTVSQESIHRHDVVAEGSL